MTDIGIDSAERMSVPDQATAPREGLSRTATAVLRMLIIVGFLALWQWLPDLPHISQHITFMDPFFISSPQLVAVRVWDICTGAGHTALIWHPFFFTVSTALIGAGVAIVLGTLAGLVLSNSPTLERLLRPFVTALNAVPRIAMVPIVVIIVGATGAADVITATTVVFFLVFYNALEGGRTAPSEMINNAKILGAGNWQIMRYVRLPLVVAWVCATIPNAIAFGLVGSVTTELFTGSAGLGEVLSTAVDTADATLTFAVVMILTATGVGLVLVADLVTKKLLPWWSSQ
jgi:NitT/TauT family transport system permease protein